MNARHWIAIAPALTVGALLLALPAQADQRGYARPGAVYAYAQVLDVEPVVRYVTVTKPVRECWNETREYEVARHTPGVAGRTIVGAILGGVIGHQFGSGSGNDAATAAGALLGAAVGSDRARREAAYETEVYSRPVKRCSTSYTQHEEERIDGYHVTYRYHGQKYATRMPYDPGNKLRIRVDVRPAE
ncbi:MAG: glycine zipper 2TM domain-containing protein [Woeseiaceae bacterium]|nr:glycine zipper 2TM domain-containing protein [Woeseiaceae bacterium]